MWFTRISIANPVLATMLMLLFVVLGLFSWQRLRVDLLPDIQFPLVVITTAYPGASPESVEYDVTRPIEEAVNSINGIKAVSSRSYEGLSVVIVEFELSVASMQATQDVRDKVALVKPSFRREVKEPKISRLDPADKPIISIAVTSTGQDFKLRELTTLTDQLIRKRIENVRGVGSVDMVGGVKREIHVNLRPEAMEAYGIGPEQVVNAVAGENQETPAGTLRAAQREQVVQIKGRIAAVADFGRVLIARRNGQPVYLDQIATVEDSEEELESLALVNGQRTLALNILKAQGENTIEVNDAVREAMAKLQKELPAEVKLSVIRNGSALIRTTASNAMETLIEGATLTVLIVFLFLGSWRSTVITGLTLPVSIIGSFLFIYAFGFTINLLTLYALSLCIGLLIDDAIVVRENIVRHAALGADHHTAALEGTREIGLAVMATTLCIVSVFLPVGFMGGVLGRFFHQFGVTVAAAVLISMFVSFTLDPMLSSIWRDPAVHGAKPRGMLGRVLAWFERRVLWLTAFYGKLLAWALKHRMATLGIATTSFIASFLLAPLVGFEFIPQMDFSETMVTFQTPIGSSLEFTEAKARQVDAVLHEFPEVIYSFTTINTAAAGKHSAIVYVKLKPRSQRTRNQVEMTVPLRARLAEIGGITVTSVGIGDPVNNSKQLSFSVQGQDLQQLERLTAVVQERLHSVPGLVDLDNSLKPAKPTIGANIRRDTAADLGIGVAQIAQALRLFLSGDDAGNWRGPDGEIYNIKVRLAAGERVSVADLERIMLTTGQVNPDGSPKMAPLRQVASFYNDKGVSQINRRDLTREVEFTANASGRSSGEVSNDVKRAMAGIDWPPGYGFKEVGQTKDMKVAFTYALQALALAVIFIYMILASQFKSFLQPLAIMSALPLTLIGVIIALLVCRSTLNVVSIIGFILLMGLVTKNAILLVDFANKSRAKGMGCGQALLEAAHVRFRPILMTTLAMVFGMLPMSLGLGEGSELSAPMGQVVIGGVITSSLLTLVVVPVIYAILDDLANWLKTRRS